MSRKEKKIETNGISYIEKVPGATEEWYFGIDYEHGDLYEAEEIFKDGHEIKGRKLCLVHYPEGKVYWPLPKTKGQYCTEPIFHDGSINTVNVDFLRGKIQIIAFDCGTFETKKVVEIPLDSVKDCYNLSLQVSPLTLTRQNVANNELEIIWPERISLSMGDHDSFYLRDDDKLFFSRWHEEGEGVDYNYWEETVIKNLCGEELEVLPGDVRLMPNGQFWHIS